MTCGGKARSGWKTARGVGGRGWNIQAAGEAWEPGGASDADDVGPEHSLDLFGKGRDRVRDGLGQARLVEVCGGMLVWGEKEGEREKGRTDCGRVEEDFGDGEALVAHLEELLLVGGRDFLALALSFARGVD